MNRRYGPNVRQGSHNDPALLQFIKDSGGVDAALFQLYPTDLQNLIQYLPFVDTLIWRQHSDERLRFDNPDPERWVDQRIVEIEGAGLRTQEVYLHLHNEAGFEPALVKWEAAAIEYGVPLGCNFVALNLPVGTPKPEMIEIADPLFSLADQYPQSVVFGLHLYFSVMSNRKPEWYHGRFMDWVKYAQNNGFRVPRIIATEAGHDYIKDDEGDFLNIYNVPHTGFRQLTEVYKRLYGGAFTSLDDCYADQTIYALDNIWTDAVEAVLGYCFGDFGFDPGNASRDWRNYDISKHPFFLKRIAAYNKQQKVPKVTPTPVTPEIVYTDGVAEVREAPSVNIRRAPNTTSDILGGIRTGDMIRYADTGVAGWWAVQKTLPSGVVTGYASRAYLFPTPEPEHPMPTTSWREALEPGQRILLEVIEFWDGRCAINGATDYNLIRQMAKLLDLKEA